MAYVHRRMCVHMSLHNGGVWHMYTDVCVCIYTYICTVEYHLAIINEIMLFVTTWLDLEGITLSEKSPTEKDKYYMIILTCGI